MNEPITPANLAAAGYRLVGNAWYKMGTTKGITAVNGGWQKWVDGKEITVTKMEEL